MKISASASYGDRRRMTVRYRGGDQPHTYLCGSHMANYGEAFCRQLAGPCLGQHVAGQVLAGVEPAALELS
jgi:hypothetical protein